jgi:di/tricarboxylate transporter
MIKIIMIVSMLLLLNSCASYNFYKNYKNNQLHKEQQKQIMEKHKSWLNI